MTGLDAVRTDEVAAARADEEAFAIRGVVEGFYGTPWTHADRLEMIRFVGERGMNRFVYSPKDDPFLRRDWAHPYGAAELAELAELVTACEAAGVELLFCLSPGLSIRYSDEGDAARLLDKFASVAALGIRHFGLLVDDVPQRLQHDADIARYGSIAEAQATLANTAFRGLRDRVPGSSLIVCPTQYWGSGDEPYVAELGRLLAPGIGLFWTGRAICSATLDTADAEVFARAAGRRPTYWDNYPVNDVAMGHELHVGPYRGRAADLPRGAEGIIANAMERFESSKIAIATIADYLRAPSEYDPEKSWDAALRAVAGRDADAYRDFADNSRSSCLSQLDAPEVTFALEEHTFGMLVGDVDRAVRTLRPLADRLAASAHHLLHEPVENQRLVDEGRAWIEALAVGARAMQIIAQLTVDGRLEADGPGALRPLLEDLRARRVRIFGDVLDMTLSDICTYSSSTEPHRERSSQSRSLTQKEQQ
ncbi:protein O-GlcNAcase [Microbacterium sp. B2969]|uniref:Protein O-GlcNAcase n=1 Tax=Microbacterium alkaliflavum TaxID=3248839 RepID=A0ABW7QCW6_9MICO